MFKKLFIVSGKTSHSKTPRATTISARKARTILEKELLDIRHRLSKLEQELTGITPISTPPDRRAA